MSKFSINEILNSDRNYILKLNKQKESLFHEMAWSNDTSLLDKYINGYSKLLRA
jgi:hypothetical protein